MEKGSGEPQAAVPTPPHNLTFALAISNKTLHITSHVESADTPHYVQNYNQNNKNNANFN